MAEAADCLVEVCAELSRLNRTSGKGTQTTSAPFSSLHDDTCKALQLTLTKALEHLRHLQQSPALLPVAEVVALQSAAQEAWNLSVSFPWSLPDDQYFKTRLRLVATHAFLAGNSFFTSESTRRAFFSGHPLQCEKCILMCLKTAKDLSRGDSASAFSSEAAEVLRFACQIAECARNRLVERLPHLMHELRFAQLTVLHAAGQFRELAEHVRQVSLEVNAAGPYGEALLQFIFSAAETFLRCSAPERVAEGHTAGTENVKNDTDVRSTTVLSMLDVSLELQRKLPAASAEFLSTTHLQKALLFFDAQRFEECSLSAQASAAAFPSLEALVLHIRASVERGDEDAIIAGLQRLADVQSSKATLEDLFAVATLVTDSVPALFPAVDKVLHSVFSAPAVDGDGGDDTVPARGTDFSFRYLGYLFHVSSAASVEAALRFIRDSSTAVVGTPYARLILEALWRCGRLSETSTSGTDTAPSEGALKASVLPSPLRTECLRCCLEVFAEECASTEEHESLLTDLAALALEGFTTDRNAASLQVCADLFTAFESKHARTAATAPTERSTTYLLYATELAYCLSADDRAERLSALVQASNSTARAVPQESATSCTTTTTTSCTDELACAYGSLINFFLRCDNLATAGEIAATAGGARDQGANTESPKRLPFSAEVTSQIFKVTAVSALSNQTFSQTFHDKKHDGNANDVAAEASSYVRNDSEPHQPDLSLVSPICEVVCEHILSADSVAVEERRWWCHFLLYVSDVVLLSDAPTAVRYGAAALEFLLAHPAAVGAARLPSAAHTASGDSDGMGKAVAAEEADDTIADSPSPNNDGGQLCSDEHELICNEAVQLLHTEFQLFSCDAPVMPLEQLTLLLDFLSRTAASRAASGIVDEKGVTQHTRLLASAERCVRQCATDPEHPLFTIAPLLEAAVPPMYLHSLASSCACVGVRAGQDRLEALAVDLELACASTLLDAVLDSARASPGSVSLLLEQHVRELVSCFYRAYCLCFSGDRRLHVSQSLRTALTKLMHLHSTENENEEQSGPADTRGWLQRIFSNEDDEESRATLTVLEFFLVEASNSFVKTTALREQAMAASWKQVCDTLRRFVPNDNQTAAAVSEIISRVSLL